MATVIEVMAKLTGNSSSMVAAFNEAKSAAETTARSAKVSGEQAQAALGKIAIPAAIITGGVALAAKQFANLASEAEQNIGAVESVFKQYADTVQQTSAQAAENVGISSSAYQQFASVVGSQLKNMGVPLKDVAGGTEDLIKKGADLASMFGGTTSDAISAISSMLRGETDPIERYGVSMSAASVSAQMASMGLKGLTGDALKNGQLQAKLAILTRQTADATGNFGREADTAAGAMQRANAKFEDAQSAIGQALLPLMTQLAQALAEASKWASANSQTVLILGGVLAGAALAILAVVGAMKVYEISMALGTVATFLFQNALKGVGIGILLVIIVAVAANIKHLWDTSEQFRSFWTAAWEQIKGGLSGALGVAKQAIDGFIPGLQTMWEWMQNNTTTINTIAAVIAAVLLPVFIRAGVAATISAAAQVVAWLAAGAGAVKAGIMYVVASYQIIGGWIAQGAAAVASGAITVAIWALYAAEAIKGAAAFMVNVARVVGGWILMGAQSMIAAARMAAAWFIALGPIGWVIAIVIGLVAIIIANWDAIATWTAQAWNNIVNFIVSAWNTIVGWVVGAVTAFVTPIIDGFNSMVGFITAIFTAIGSFISGVWNWIFNLLTAIGQAFWAEHGAQLTAAWNFIVSIFTGILNFYIAIWTGIFTFIVGMVTAIVTGIATGFTAAVSWVVSTATAIWTVIVTVFTTVWNFIVSVFTAIGSSLAAAWNFYVSLITGVLSAIWGVIVSVFTAVWGFISGIFNTVAGFIGGIWNSIFATIAGAVQSVWGTVSAGFNAVWGVISSVFGQVVGFLGGIWGNIISGVSGMIGRVGGFFSGLWGTITGALSGAGTWLLQAGANIVQGLINGISSLAGTIGSAFLSMVPGWIVEPFKKALGIASPSKVFTQFGRWIVEGLVNGVHAKGPAAVKAIRTVADRLTDAANQSFKKAWGLQGGARAYELRVAQNLSTAARQVNAQIARIGQLANQKVALAARLKDAQKRLNDAINARSKKAADVSGKLRDEYDLGALVGYSAKDVAVQTKIIGDRIRAFGTKVAQLRKMGLSAAMIDEVAALGSQNGSIMADSLMKGDAKTIKQINSAYQGIGASASTTGAAVAIGMYQTGVDAVAGLVRGIQSNIRSVDAAASTIANRLTAQVKKSLGIRSPSRVFMALAGFVMQGLGIGIRQGTGGAVADMGKAAEAVAAVKFKAPALKLPEVPNIAAQLALPTLTQDVHLNFIGTSPVDAIRQLEARIQQGGVEGGLGYNSAAVGGGKTTVAPAPAPAINLTAMIENPWGEGYLEAKVVSIAEGAAADALTGTARAARSKRGSAVGSW